MRAPWLFAAAWLLLPFLAGPVIADALTDTTTPGRTVVSVALWAAWAVVLVATLVPRTSTLTVVRTIAPTAPLVAVWATANAGFDSWAAVGLAAATVAAVLVFDPAVGEAFVNGSAYGPEVRLPLRVPAGVMVGPLPIAWLAAVAGLAVGPLLLAYERWVPGAVATVLGFPLAALAVRSLHTLSRRWFVLVPGGLVIHDPLALREPVLLPQNLVVALEPAPAEGTDRLDLSGAALGLAMQIDLADPLVFGVVEGRSGAELVTSACVIATPTRPGRLVELGSEHLRLRS